MKEKCPNIAPLLRQLLPVIGEQLRAVAQSRHEEAAMPQPQQSAQYSSHKRMAELRSRDLPQFQWVPTAALVVVAARMVRQSWTMAPIRCELHLSRREPQQVAGQRRKVQSNSEPVES